MENYSLSKIRGRNETSGRQKHFNMGSPWKEGIVGLEVDKLHYCAHSKTFFHGLWT